MPSDMAVLSTSGRRRVELVAAAVVAGYLVGALLGWRGTPVGDYASNLGTAGAAFLGGGLCLRTARAAPGLVRSGWLLIGASALSWALGQCVWSWYELAAARPTPFPSLADVGFLAAVPLALAGLLCHHAALARRLSVLRTALDGALVALALLLVGWLLVLGPMYRAGADSDLELVIGLAYPTGDVALLTVALLTARRTVRGHRAPLLLLVGGIGALVTADTMFALLSLSDRYDTGGLADVLWLSAFLLYGIAALHHDEPPAEPTAPAETTPVAALLPYAVLVPALGVLAVVSAVDRSVGSVELTILGGLLAVLLGRQSLMVLDNVGLARALASGERHFRTLVQSSSDVTTLLEPDGTIRWQSPAVERVCGYEPGQLHGRPLEEFLHPDDVGELVRAVQEARSGDGESVVVECRIRDAAGAWRQTESIVTDCLDDPAVGAVVVNTRDVSDRRDLEHRLRWLAFRDELTGLANRALLRDRLSHALAARTRSDKVVALLYLDLDGFKQVNDTLGHAEGDRLLVEAATRLADAARPGDTVARLGGDEFAVLLELTVDDGHAWHVAQRLLDRLREPYVLSGTEVRVTASVGITVAGPESDADALLQESDLAMYAAKTAGKSRCTLYDPHMRERVLERAELERNLRAALAEGSLWLQYQPIVDLGTSEVVGIEALARWRHPERGLVPPAEFVGIAEESGLIEQLGAWVLDEACTFAATLHAAGHRLRLAVNLSPRQLRDPLLPNVVGRALERAGLVPAALLLEITEGLVVEDTAAAVSRLAALRRLGVRIAVDDFGTGYSSLSYLPRLPIDVLKIDSSFITGITTTHDLHALTSAVVGLGAQLGLDVVAEGVEDEAQAAALRAMGCPLAQGYLFAPPLSAADVLPFLTGRPARGDVPGPRSGGSGTARLTDARP